jgi:hypothetical protein
VSRSEREFARLAALLHEAGRAARDLVSLVKVLPPMFHCKWREIGRNLVRGARRHSGPLAPTRAAEASPGFSASRGVGRGRQHPARRRLPRV